MDHLAVEAAPVRFRGAVLQRCAGAELATGGLLEFVQRRQSRRRGTQQRSGHHRRRRRPLRPGPARRSPSASRAGASRGALAAHPI